MNKILCLIGVVVGLQRTGFAFNPSYVQSVASWNALRSAASPNRMIVLFFTASQGNCRDCELMKQKFYSSREFTSWVDQFALLGEVDLSIGRTDFQDGRETYSMITGEVGELVKVARMRSLPSIALYGSDGKLYDWASANSDPENVAHAFHMAYQKQVSNVPLPKLPKSSDPSPAAPAPAASALKLKMISGPPQRRLATINNETFFAGETHRISVGNVKLSVQCLEIGEKSALVKVDGEMRSRELNLGQSESVSIAGVPADSQSGVSIGTMPASQWFVAGTLFLAEAVFYLSFCWSCRQLCRRAGHPSILLVWLPGLKHLALLRAAGMSWFWFFFPIFSLCAWSASLRHAAPAGVPWFWFFLSWSGLYGWIVCCGRLCATFNKTKWWVPLMIWPVLGWPVFMYLAWTSRAEDDEPAVRVLDRGRQFA